MKANADFRLRRLDEYNWVIDQRVVFKKKNSKGKSWRTVGYYPTLELACQRLLDRVLLSGKDEPSIRDLIREVKAAREYISKSVLTQLSAGTAGADAQKVGGPRISQMSHMPQGATGKP